MAKKAKARTSAKKSKAAKKNNAKKARAKLSTKKRAKVAVKKAVKKAAEGALGCCTIVYDDHSEEVPNVTKQRCISLGIQRGGTGQWNPGSCA